MGHTQCVSKTQEADIQTLQRREKGPVPVAAAPTRTNHMILPDAPTDKTTVPVRFKSLGQGVTSGDPTEDADRVERAMAHLRESGWYWGSLTAAQAKQVLSGALEGTFLLRDSSNPGYLLTLSVKTSLGPTHLRIEHSAGAFGFDSLAVARPRLRRFSGAVELVLHYAMASQSSAGGDTWPDQESSDGSLQLRLTRPLCRTAPSLQHLCRITINRHSCSPQELPLPPRLKAYLQEYPFSL
ncbi:suppressor of cytokine signaling 2-like [Brienomyrus brachyistius]|uniref:suppressor of cytokine signaling 2-like n=1 Tax=Brienomyrus brachyistius TaxID=42636 RepID=UPI0020B24A8D|nr:suppressor of cytokine signaling 2-like [Brienomyrus brachyistius]